MAASSATGFEVRDALSGQTLEVPDTVKSVGALQDALAGVVDTNRSDIILLHGPHGTALSSEAQEAPLPSAGCIFAFSVSRMSTPAEELTMPAPPAWPLPDAAKWPPSGTSQYPLASMTSLQSALEASTSPAASGVLLPVMASVAAALGAMDVAFAHALSSNSVLDAADAVSRASKAAGANLAALHAAAVAEVTALAASSAQLRPTTDRLRSRLPVYLSRVQAVTLHGSLSGTSPPPSLASVLDMDAMAEGAEATWTTAATAAGEVEALAEAVQSSAGEVGEVVGAAVVPPSLIPRVQGVISGVAGLKEEAKAASARLSEAWGGVVTAVLPALTPSASPQALRSALEDAERLRVTVETEGAPAAAALVGRGQTLTDTAYTCLLEVRKTQAALLQRVGAAQAATSSLMAQSRALDSKVQAWRRGLQAVASLRALPSAYRAAEHEVARRRAYGRLLLARVQSMVSVLEGSALREAGRRRRFAQRHGTVLPAGLIPGLEGGAPEVALSATLHDQDLPPIDNVPAAMSGTAESAGSSVVSPGMGPTPTASEGSLPPPLTLGAAHTGESDDGQRVEGSERQLRQLVHTIAVNSGIEEGSVGTAPRTSSDSSSGNYGSSVLGADQSLLLRLREVEAENTALRAALASKQATAAAGGLLGLAVGSGEDTPVSGDSGGPAASPPTPPDVTTMAGVNASVQEALLGCRAPAILEAFAVSVESQLSEHDVEDVGRVRRHLLEAMGDAPPTAAAAAAPRTPAAEVVWRTTSQLTRLLSFAVRAARNLQEAAGQSIAFTGFSPGRNALFMRAPWPLAGVAGAHPKWQYVAFNVGAPHYYASNAALPQSVLTSLPDYIVLSMTDVSGQVASPEHNPFGVQVGTPFFVVQGTVVATGAPLSASPALPTPTASAPASPASGLVGARGPATPTGGGIGGWGEGAGRPGRE